jgi:hypothetical protein
MPTAPAIEHNAKGRALLTALEVAFAKAAELGAAQKAIIFTESRRTQSYLLRVLADSPFAGGIVLFNGSNTDERSKQIYAEWLQRHEGTDRITGSRTADLRAALVDYFREQGRIMRAVRLSHPPSIPRRFRLVPHSPDRVPLRAIPQQGESPGGISPPGARRTVLERLRSYGSHHPAVGLRPRSCQ